MTDQEMKAAFDGINDSIKGVNNSLKGIDDRLAGTETKVSALEAKVAADQASIAALVKDHPSTTRKVVVGGLKVIGFTALAVTTSLLLRPKKAAAAQLAPTPTDSYPTTARPSNSASARN